MNTVKKRETNPAATPGPNPDEEEVQITFLRSINGKERTIPVWFTINKGKMELLPMYGLKTRWFREIENNGKVGLRIKEWRLSVKPTIVRDPSIVDGIKGRFGTKYGDNQVRKYYPTSEVALEVSLG